MSTTHESRCDQCTGTGMVWEYRARDIMIGTNEVSDHTYEVECPSCLGQGHIRVNPTDGKDNVSPS